MQAPGVNCFPCFLFHLLINGVNTEEPCDHWVLWKYSGQGDKQAYMLRTDGPVRPHCVFPCSGGFLQQRLAAERGDNEQHCWEGAHAWEL